MGGGDVFVIGSSFLEKYSHPLTAILTLVLTFAFAVLADRAISHWAAHADLDPGLDTVSGSSGG